MKNLIPVFIKSIWYARCSSVDSSGSGHPENGSDIGFLHNLMNALAAKVVRICDFTKRKATRAHLNNFRISVKVRRRPWLQRTPGPAWQLLQRFGFVRRQLTLLIPLTHVTYPSPEVHLTAVHDFHMYGWDAGVSSALGELGQRSYIKFESGVVVHACTV